MTGFDNDLGGIHDEKMLTFALTISLGSSLFYTVPFMAKAAAYDHTFVITGVDENGSVLSGNHVIGRSQFQELTGSDRIPEYGDVYTGSCTCDIGEYLLPVDPGRFSSFGDLHLTYAGTADTYYADSARTLTVTEKTSYLVLVDEDGTEYTWSPLDEPCYVVPEEFALTNYSVGDVISCAVKGTNVIIPLTPASKHPPMKGDIDCNGTVNIMDVILLNRHLMIGVEISEQGMQNALTYTANDGIALQSDNAQRQPDAVDSLNILKYVVGLISEL